MRLSTVAALLILTTVMLSLTACSQDHMASVVDYSGQVYTRAPMPDPKYSSWNPAPKNETSDYKYKGSDSYAVEAEIETVATSDLAPPVASTSVIKEAERKDGSFLLPGETPRFRWPVQGQLLRSYGAEKQGVVNEGIAISTPRGMPIRASADGEVAYVGNALKDFGNMVILRHANGFMTSYAHADQIIVAEGTQVKGGALLGYVGKTGNVAAPQLHFTLRENDKTVNPLTYLPRQLASR
jgi:murein DD-endopeptidase MepM/ murein hydrolase activator NlpD